MKMLRNQHGFNLIELMFAVLIMAITVNYATPAVQTFMEKNHLKQAAERIYHFYRYARSEAIKQNKVLYVRYFGDGSSAWSFGLSADSNCVPTDTSTDPSPCLITVSDIQVQKTIINGSTGVDYNNISMSLENPSGTAVNDMEIMLDPVRGSSTAGGIVLATSNGWKLRNRISPLGEIQICVPAGAPPLVGYRACS